jgi:hypothetical protein
VGKPSAQENKKDKTADLTLPIYCRNATEPLQFVILFHKDKVAVRAIDEEHRNDRGELTYRKSFNCSEKIEAQPIVIHLPATLVAKNDRKIDATTYVFSEAGQFVEEYKSVSVHFPKP